MTKSSGTPKSASRPPGQGLVMLTLIFRLLLLTVGGGVAWVIGIAIAQVYPAPTPEMPLIEKILRRTPNFSPNPVLPPSPTPSPSEPSPEPSPSVQLNPAEREQLQIELRQLQAQLNQLIGRTTLLETQLLGGSRPTETLEKRLELISQQFTPSPGGIETVSVPEREELPDAASSSSFISENALTITVPSDVIFELGSSTLQSGSNILLDNLIAELRNYQGARIQVAGHTDDQGESIQNRELSFRQAEAVMAYFASILGDQYHWVAVGYGETRPVVQDTTDVNRQRNRRLEISIHL